MAEINYERVSNTIQTFLMYRLAIHEESLRRIQIIWSVHIHWRHQLTDEEGSLFSYAVNQLMGHLSYRRKSG